MGFFMAYRLILACSLAVTLVFTPFEAVYAKKSFSGGKSSRQYSYSQKKSPVKSGIYKFTASNGKQYIGKSIDMGRRLKEHMKSGKLKDSSTVKTEKYKISNKGLLAIEKAKIRVSDALSKSGLANKQNAPFSRSKEKALTAFSERKQKV